MRLAQMAGVKKLAIFHHDPGRSDDVLDATGEEAASLFGGAFIAREGTTLSP